MSIIVGVCPWILIGLFAVRSVHIIKRSSVLNEIGWTSYRTLSSFHKQSNSTEILDVIMSIDLE